LAGAQTPRRASCYFRDSTLRRPIEETFAEFDTGLALLEKHATESLGETPADRNVRIMVTTPCEAVDDPILIRDF
jgi:hypothetical protein